MNDDMAEDLGLPPEYAELRAQLARGTKLASLRRLQLVCPHDQQLAAVLWLNGQAFISYNNVIPRMDYTISATGRLTGTQRGEWTGKSPRLEQVAPGEVTEAANKCCIREIDHDIVVQLLAARVRRHVLT